MKKSFTKILSIALTVVMLLSIAPLNGFKGLELFNSKASAGSTYRFEYEIENGEATIVKCLNSDVELIIPSEFEGCPVTKIGDYAFSGWSNMKQVTIPDSVTSIGKRAFSGCYGLKSITIPENVISIGAYAFSSCSQLNSVNIPNKVTSIGEYAFKACYGLKSINIGDSVAEIGEFAFEECQQLESITVSENNRFFSSDSYGALYNKAQTLLICYPRENPNTSYIMPNTVTDICDKAFYGCENLTSIEISDKVTSIGKSVFEYCLGLTSITIPQNVQKIHSTAFNTCISVTSFSVSEKNKFFCSSDGVLYNKDKTVLVHYPAGRTETSFTVPDGVKDIYDYAFYESGKLLEVTIPESVVRIGAYSFYFCIYLTNVNLSEGLRFIDNYAFWYCEALKNITLPDSLEYIGIGAFMGSGLEKIEIGDNVREISAGVFAVCQSLKEVIIGNSVKKIGFWAFGECKKIESITVPDSVVCLDGATFNYCTSLREIHLGENLRTIGEIVFEDTAFIENEDNWENGALYVDNYLIDVNEVVDDKLTVKPGTKVIAAGALNNCSETTEVILPDGLKGIGIENFWNNYFDISEAQETGFLYSNDYLIKVGDVSGDVVLKPNTKLIVDDAFLRHEKITKVVIPDGIQHLGAYAFYECTNLQEVVIPESVKRIECFTFFNCYSLTNVTIPKGVESLDTDAFANCINLEKVSISETVTDIEAGAFASCESLKEVTIPKNVEYIGLYAFGYSRSGSEWHHEYEKYNDFKIYCYSGTAGEEYAIRNGFDYELISEHDDYNLKEETYSFKNFGDSDSAGGHCFGMSTTSAGYYLDFLNIASVGGNTTDDVYGLTKISTVTKPICRYQSIQGSRANAAIVAGGSTYLTGKSNISSDWKAVINYVKNHDYDGKGLLQIGYRKNNVGGHAINFLRYEVVDGQERIYAYDNNFPDIETYFYMDNYGNVKQAPRSTFNGSIDCIALRSVPTYYKIVDGADISRFIYADKDAIAIEDVPSFLMEGELELGERVMFEVPDGVDEVEIKPLVENATFMYLGKEYSFENADENTTGVLKLANSEDDVVDVDFEIQKPEAVLNEIYIKTAPSKTQYNFKETVSTNGMTVIAKYSDGSEVDITDRVSVKDFATSQRGDKTATVKFEGKTATFNYKVSYTWWQWIIKIVLFGWIWYN